MKKRKSFPNKYIVNHMFELLFIVLANLHKFNNIYQKIHTCLKRSAVTQSTSSTMIH